MLPLNSHREECYSSITASAPYITHAPDPVDILIEVYVDNEFYVLLAAVVKERN